jgi:hypothetical protein
MEHKASDRFSVTADAPFPVYDDQTLHYKLSRWEFENNFNDTGEHGSTLAATGSPTFTANANTQPVAQGEDRVGQSRGTFLLNGTASYDYEGTLSDTATWTCVSAPVRCDTLTIRDPNKLATFVDGATAVGTYTFSLQVNDGSNSPNSLDQDSSVTIQVVSVSASAASASCFVDEACVIDASASTGYEKIHLAFGDKYSVPLARTVHVYRSTGTKGAVVTATAAITKVAPGNQYPTVSSAPIVVTISARPAADAANTQDLTNSISASECTSDPVGNMQKLQSAYDTAKGRNTVPQKIVVRADNGAGTRCTYQGQLVLKQAAGTEQILIESSGLIPAPKKRAKPSDAADMPQLLTNAVNTPVVITDEGAVKIYVKFRGIDFQSSANQDTAIIQLGAWDSIDTFEEIPHHVVFQHCLVRPTSESGVDVKNGIRMDANDVTILDSTIGPNSYPGTESHAISTVTSQGRHGVVNSFISAGSISSLYGGATSRVVGCVPSDLEFRENYFFKDPSWRTDGRSRAVKNLFEFKNARRAAIYGNRFENNWIDGQDAAILMQSQPDTGDWAEISDIAFFNNFVLNAPTGLTLRAREYPQRIVIKRVTISNNLFQNINASLYGGGIGRVLAVFQGPTDVRWEHNTARQPGNATMVTLDSTGTNGRAAGFVWKDNIADHGSSDSPGFVGESTAPGVSSMTKFLPGAVITYSLAVGGSEAAYPSGAHWQFPQTESAVGFRNPSANDWSLADGSDYKGDASDGTDPGVDWSALQRQIANTVTGDWSGGTFAVVANGTTQYGRVTLPNAAPFTSLGGFQIVWRARGTGAGDLFDTDFMRMIGAAGASPQRFDFYEWRENGSIFMPPTDFTDAICKLQYDPANSRWTFETWKPDGTGYVSRTLTITNTANFNFGGTVLTIAGNQYGNSLAQVKLDYWRWIQRVEPLGMMPTASAPTGVTYLTQYEFEGNGNDSSGRGLHLTLQGNPSFENTP